MREMLAFFPPHTTYVSGFGGSAADILRKPPAKYEVYNDLDQNVWNFFDCLRRDPKALVRAIELTPYCQDEYYRACATVAEGEPIERAVKFYTICWQGMAYSKPGSGWRLLPYNGQQAGGRQFGGHDPVRLFNATEHLYAIAERLKQVQICNQDYKRLIARCDYPDCLWFFDPPYRQEVVRSDVRRLYTHGEFDHFEFLHNVLALRGMAIVCGYDSNLYASALSDWTRKEFKARDRGGNPRTEVIWLNPAAAAKLNSQQMELFK